MKRLMQLVLGVNIAVATIVGFTGYVLHVGPEGAIAGAEPVLGHALAAVYLGFVVTLAVAMLKFEREPVWLLIPVFFQLPLWMDALYELSAGGSDIPPAIIRPVFCALYIAGYVAVNRSVHDRGVTATPAEASR